MTKEVAILNTNMGRIMFEFFPEDAPRHVENFKKLASRGFYDGTRFHRVIPNFMIQGETQIAKEMTGRSMDLEAQDILSMRNSTRGSISVALFRWRAQETRTALGRNSSYALNHANG